MIQLFYSHFNKSEVAHFGTLAFEYIDTKVMIKREHNLLAGIEKLPEQGHFYESKFTVTVTLKSGAVITESYDVDEKTVTDNTWRLISAPVRVKYEEFVKAMNA